MELAEFREQLCRGVKPTATSVLILYLSHGNDTKRHQWT